MAGSDITIRTGDGTPFQAYLAGDTPSRPAVIMFTPIFGVDADAKAIADRWADRGYLVAVPDYYFRQAPGVLDRSESGRKSAMERWKALNVDRAVSDMRGLADYLLARPSCNGRLAALGFCAGGELAFLAATRLGATAVATFHATHIDRHLLSFRRDEISELAGRALHRRAAQVTKLGPHFSDTARKAISCIDVPTTVAPWQRSLDVSVAIATCATPR
jgi:carboxymethylenebutenolidase